jgi:hypothetical protein
MPRKSLRLSQIYGATNAIYRDGLIASAMITDTGNQQTQFMQSCSGEVCDITAPARSGDGFASDQ